MIFITFIYFSFYEFIIFYEKNKKSIPLHKTSPCSFLLQSGVVEVPQFEQVKSSDAFPSFLKGGGF